MKDEQNKQIEPEIITPVIKDFELIFSKISTFILSLIRGIWALFQNTITTFFENIKIVFPLVIAAGCLGFFSTSFAPYEYKSSMVLGVQFEAHDQLYSGANYLNSLVANKNWKTLSEIFGLHESEVTSITGVSVEPVYSIFDKAKRLDYMKESIDTSSYSIFNEKELISLKSPFLYNNHSIKIFSTNPSIFNGMDKKLTEYLEDNPFYALKRSTKESSLNNQKENYLNEILKIDSLINLSSELRMIDAKNKKASNTTINMSSENNSSQLDPIQLIRLKEEYRDKANEIQQQLIDNQNIYKKVSELAQEGTRISFGRTTRALILGSIVFLISISIIISLQAFKK